MKIKSTSNRIPGTGRPFSAGKSTVEMFLFLVLAYFGVSAGINKVKDFQSQQLTDAKLHDIAERVVFITESAERAGVDLIVDGDITATVERVSQGGTAKYGAFRGQFYGMPELKGKAKDKVTRHLQLHYGQLRVKQFESFASAE